MINITFKNVGQGDSIIVEWKVDTLSKFGIIDCNLFEGTNPILDEVKKRKINYIDFIVLSHLHIDHYSGFGELFEYLIQKKIRVGIFLHTFTIDFLKILSSILITQVELNNTEKFFTKFNIAQEQIFDDFDDITHNLADISLTDDIKLSFYAPAQADYLSFANSQARYLSKTSTTKPDFNSLATILGISNALETIILTSDATKKALKRVKGKIKKTVKLIQVPHHGSKHNMREDFWAALSVTKSCPSIFSIGDVPKDKLPDIDVVKYFDTHGYYNFSTNFVYGIQSYYGTPTPIHPVSVVLSAFSKKINTTAKTITPPRRFAGDKNFELL